VLGCALGRRTCVCARVRAYACVFVCIPVVVCCACVQVLGTAVRQAAGPSPTPPYPPTLPPLRLKIRSALDALTPGADGVDGAGVYLYGEAWDFGEVGGGGVAVGGLAVGGWGLGAALGWRGGGWGLAAWRLFGGSGLGGGGRWAVAGGVWGGGWRMGLSAREAAPRVRMPRWPESAAFPARAARRLQVALNARGRNACQLNIGGLRIGAFNDRRAARAALACGVASVGARRGWGPQEAPARRGQGRACWSRNDTRAASPGYRCPDLSPPTLHTVPPDPLSTQDARRGHGGQPI
jgi:hypothetical protein